MSLNLLWLVIFRMRRRNLCKNLTVILLLVVVCLIVRIRRLKILVKVVPLIMRVRFGCLPWWLALVRILVRFVLTLTKRKLSRRLRVRCSNARHRLTIVSLILRVSCTLSCPRTLIMRLVIRKLLRSIVM